MSVHLYSGVAAVALMVFRLTWGIWGALYARWRWYFTTPWEVLGYFRGQLRHRVHTPPGIALAVMLLTAITIQSLSGLFMTDDVFFEGPLHRFASPEVVDTSRVLHHRVWMVIVALVSMHLLAHLTYALLLRSATPLSMFTGRKPLVAPATEHKIGNLILSVVCAVATFASLLYYAL